jgi:ligand-binding sensor domain-containing protein
MWFGTNKGISAYNTKTREFTNYGPENLPGKTVHALKLDGNTLWIGTSAGLAKYGKESGEFEKITLPVEGQGNDVVHVLAIDGNTVWIGTRIGIHVYDKTTGEFMTYGEDDLPDTWVNDIIIEEDTVWVATLKGGVAVLNRDKDKWKVINEKKGLASDDVRRIEPVGDITWIGTLRGLNKYDPAQAAKQAQKYILYGVLVAAAIAAVVAAKLTIFKPSEEEIERKKRDQDARAKRKERKRTGTPSWKLCNGVPRKDLCGRCKYNAVKAGKLHCSKYDIDLEQ